MHNEQIKEQTSWAVVRYSTDGYAYIDTETIACLPELAIKKAREADEHCGPQWAKANRLGKAVEVVIAIKKNHAD